jgi:hypothetical protein
MPGTVVGLYCAVVEPFELLVSSRATAARETQAVFNRRAESLRTWLGALNLGSGRPGSQNLRTRRKGYVRGDCPLLRLAEWRFGPERRIATFGSGRAQRVRGMEGSLDRLRLKLVRL